MDIYYYITNISYALFGVLNLLLIWDIIDYVFAHVRNRHCYELKEKDNICIIVSGFLTLIITINIQIYFFSKRHEIISDLDKIANVMLYFVAIILHSMIFQRINRYVNEKFKKFIVNDKGIVIKENPCKKTEILKRITNSCEEFNNHTFIFNAITQEISLNESMESILGYTKEELVHVKLPNLISKNRIETLKQFCSQKDKSCEINILIDIKRKDGQFIIAKLSGALIVSQGKKIIKGSIKEVTEKIAVEIDILKTNIILKEMLENMQRYKVIVLDKDYRILLINNEGKEFIKKRMTKRVSEGMNFIDIISMIDTEYKLGSTYPKVEKGIKGASEGKVITNVIEIPSESNGPIEGNESNEKEYMETQYIGLKDNEENIVGIAILTHDITETYKSKEELIKAKEKATEANKTKSQFLANMSHEIRTPMNGISGLTDIMLKTELDDNQKIMMKSIRDSAANLLDIINDLLDFSKIESGKFYILNKPFNFYKLIDEIKLMFLTKAMEKKIKIEYHIDENINELLIGDKLRLKQILINLIGNAIKFTEEGKVTVRISKEDDENTIKFQVIDTGIGIQEEYLDIIFDSFTQVEESYEKRFSGTGLGLAITKELVEALGGKIAVNTKINVGSEFSFSIKFKEVDNYTSNKRLEKMSYQKEAMKYIDKIDMENIHILVAEDNEVNRLLIEKLISLNKWTCTIVKNGKEAIEVLEKEKFHIILMDISMPIMNGIEAMRIIKNNSKWNHIPIIALTAHSRTQDRKKFISLGMDDYLSKPIDKDKLKFTIMKNLAEFNREENTAAFDRDEKENCNEYQQDQKIKFSKKLEELIKLQEKLDGDKELVIELGVELILLFSNEEMTELKDKINSNNSEEVREEVHKLKGAVMNFGLCNVYHLLNKIKVECDFNERDKNNVLINEIMEEISIFKEAIMVYKYIH